MARNTVIQVYEQLTIEGYVTAATGRGTYVADISQDLIETMRARHELGDPAISLPIRNLSERGIRLIDRAGFAQRQHGAFMPGVPEVDEFPVRQWERIQNKHWRQIRPERREEQTSDRQSLMRIAINVFGCTEN